MNTRRLIVEEGGFLYDSDYYGDELPFWVKVAHKWGDLPQARNDVGAVFTPRGSYVVAVLTEDAMPDESASLQRASKFGKPGLPS